MPEGRKPDFKLSAMNMDTRRKGPCGAAWKNDDGSISVVLDPWVKLEGDGASRTKVQLMLFPNDGDEGYKKRAAAAEARKKQAAVDELDLEDDIPF